MDIGCGTGYCFKMKENGMDNRNLSRLRKQGNKEIRRLGIEVLEPEKDCIADGGTLMYTMGTPEHLHDPHNYP